MSQMVGTDFKLNSISDLRQEYKKDELLENKVPGDPFKLFAGWFENAAMDGVKEPNAMVLSTVSDGKPKARVVLLKDFSEKGFSFYTNYNSHKGQELDSNNFASVTFFWDKSERQVRIEGEIEKVSAQESDNYFHSRPIGSQIGAWVSQQSEKIEGRSVLEKKLTEMEEKFAGQSIIPRPDHWGGYLLKPQLMEFWQGRANRLHDRICYTLDDSGLWNFFRLSP